MHLSWKQQAWNKLVQRFVFLEGTKPSTVTTVRTQMNVEGNVV